MLGTFWINFKYDSIFNLLSFNEYSNDKACTNVPKRINHSLIPVLNDSIKSTMAIIYILKVLQYKIWRMFSLF